MPNWVYNNVEVTGKPEDLAKFAEKASQPYQVSPDWEEKDGSFFFWNFKKPTDLEAYVKAGDHSLSLAQQLMVTGDNWYDWNIREWGTKWEASASEVNTDHIAEGRISYTFDTAWSQPAELFITMVEQHPELTFEIRWEEEQGWGGKAFGTNGFFAITDEWDIPESHAENKALDRECVCEYDDESEWYDDCPRPTDELADKIKNQIIEQSGVSKEWADKHLIIVTGDN